MVRGGRGYRGRDYVVFVLIQEFGRLLVCSSGFHQRVWLACTRQCSSFSQRTTCLRVSQILVVDFEGNFIIQLKITQITATESVPKPKRNICQLLGKNISVQGLASINPSPIHAFDVRHLSIPGYTKEVFDKLVFFYVKHERPELRVPAPYTPTSGCG
ncbi:hypothetical protein CPB85DRAFT_901747 [Mucidula mucida]|nr:hypothetical protein CPB85DRAFT_901747 [Mucidula mucida]